MDPEYQKMVNHWLAETMITDYSLIHK